MTSVGSCLRREIHRYNDHQVHSTTKEIPNLRFDQARKAGNSLFRPFTLPQPYTSPQDVFCLRETRFVDGYRSISLFNHKIKVPNVPLRTQVQVHLIPDMEKHAMRVRIWWKDRKVRSLTLPMQESTVHF